MKQIALTCLLLAMCLGNAYAHSDEYLSEHARAHGGQMRIAGPYHLELVMGAQQQLTLYVTDHSGTAVDTAGGSAKVIITSGKKKRYVVILSSGGENTLKGEGEFKLSKASTASVLIALRGQEPQRAKFALSARRKTAKKSHKTR
jgi:hypothetical protein